LVPSSRRAPPAMVGSSFSTPALSNFSVDCAAGGGATCNTASSACRSWARRRSRAAAALAAAQRQEHPGYVAADSPFSEHAEAAAVERPNSRWHKKKAAITTAGRGCDGMAPNEVKLSVRSTEAPSASSGHSNSPKELERARTDAADSVSSAPNLYVGCQPKSTLCVADRQSVPTLRDPSPGDSNSSRRYSSRHISCEAPALKCRPGALREQDAPAEPRGPGAASNISSNGSSYLDVAVALKRTGEPKLDTGIVKKSEQDSQHGPCMSPSGLCSQPSLNGQLSSGQCAKALECIRPPKPTSDDGLGQGADSRQQGVNMGTEDTSAACSNRGAASETQKPVKLSRRSSARSRAKQRKQQEQWIPGMGVPRPRLAIPSRSATNHDVVVGAQALVMGQVEPSAVRSNLSFDHGGVTGEMPPPRLLMRSKEQEQTVDMVGAVDERHPQKTLEEKQEDYLIARARIFGTTVEKQWEEVSMGRHAGYRGGWMEG